MKTATMILKRSILLFHAIAPFMLLVIAVLGTAWIVSDVRLHFSVPLRAFENSLSAVGTALATAKQQVGQIAERTAEVKTAVRGIERAAERIPTTLQVPRIALPAATLPVRPELRRERKNLGLKKVSIVTGIDMLNASVRLPAVPAFTINAAPLGQVKTVLRETSRVAGDISDIGSRIARLGPLSDALAKIENDTAALINAVRAVGTTLAIVLLAFFAVLLPWLAISYARYVYAQSIGLLWWLYQTLKLRQTLFGA